MCSFAHSDLLLRNSGSFPGYHQTWNRSIRILSSSIRCPPFRLLCTRHHIISFCRARSPAASRLLLYHVPPENARGVYLKRPSVQEGRNSSLQKADHLQITQDKTDLVRSASRCSDRHRSQKQHQRTAGKKITCCIRISLQRSSDSTASVPR